MNETEARVVLLEDALAQARNTITFMHGCLTWPAETIAACGENGAYAYRYPDHTQQMVDQIDALVGEPRVGCVHSRLRPDECESCKWLVGHMKDVARAKSVLSNEEQR